MSTNDDGATTSHLLAHGQNRNQYTGSEPTTEQIPGYARHEVIGEVRFIHSMNGQEHDGPWKLMQFPNGKHFYCMICRTGIDESAPNMFGQLYGAYMEPTTPKPKQHVQVGTTARFIRDPGNRKVGRKPSIVGRLLECACGEWHEPGYFEGWAQGVSDATAA